MPPGKEAKIKSRRGEENRKGRCGGTLASKMPSSASEKEQGTTLRSGGGQGEWLMIKRKGGAASKGPYAEIPPV